MSDSKKHLSFIDRLKGKQKESGGFKDVLEEMNIRMMKDERFAVRVELYQEFCEFIAACGKTQSDSPEKVIEETAAQVHDINNRLHQAATPFGRSGDKDKSWYSEMISCWNTLYSTVLTYISVTESTLKRLTERGGHKPENQKIQAVQKLRYFFESIFLDCALTVADLSWFGEDVTGAWIGAIQTQPMFPFGGGSTVTSSGGRTSEDRPDYIRKPNNEPVPPRGKNEV